MTDPVLWSGKYVPFPPPQFLFEIRNIKRNILFFNSSFLISFLFQNLRDVFSLFASAGMDLSKSIPSPNCKYTSLVNGRLFVLLITSFVNSSKNWSSFSPEIFSFPPLISYIYLFFKCVTTVCPESKTKLTFTSNVWTDLSCFYAFGHGKKHTTDLFHL